MLSVALPASGSARDREGKGKFMAARKSRRRMTTPARRTRTTGSGRRRVIALAGAGDTVTALGVTQPVAAASATPAGLPPGCTQSESTVACVYMTTGAAQTFTPSAGVSSAMVILTGASGGTGGAFPDLVYDPGGPGGLGATVTGAVSGTLSAHWPAVSPAPTAALEMAAACAAAMANSVALSDGAVAAAATWSRSAASSGDGDNTGAGEVTITYTAPVVCQSGAFKTGLAVAGQVCLSGATVDSAVTVQPGGSLTGTETIFRGNLPVQAGGTLALSGGLVSGSITAAYAAGVQMRRITMPGQVSVSGSAGPAVLAGPVMASGGTSGAQVAGNSIAGSVTLDDNSGSTGLVVSANTVRARWPAQATLRPPVPAPPTSLAGGQRPVRKPGPARQLSPENPVRTGSAVWCPCGLPSVGLCLSNRGIACDNSR